MCSCSALVSDRRSSRSTVPAGLCGTGWIKNRFPIWVKSFFFVERDKSFLNIHSSPYDVLLNRFVAGNSLVLSKFDVAPSLRLLLGKR